MESNQKKIPCSVGILTYNSSATLERALKSLDGFGEVIISDGGSTDDTLAIARKYGCKIISQSNSGHPITDFSLERNRTLDVSSFDWFFYLDSDEVISPELRNEIEHIANNPIPEHLVYRVLYEKTSQDFAIRYKTAKQYCQNRFFNKKSGARFKKRMHERIAFSENLSVGVIEAPWYVPLDDQLDFGTYRKKIEYRIGIMADNAQFRGVWHFIHSAIIIPLTEAMKSCVKMLYLLLRGDSRSIPPRYELYRIYSQWITMKKLTRRYLHQHKVL